MEEGSLRVCNRLSQVSTIWATAVNWQRCGEGTQKLVMVPLWHMEGGELGHKGAFSSLGGIRIRPVLTDYHCGVT